jgi:hypothetical protein
MLIATALNFMLAFFSKNTSSFASSTSTSVALTGGHVAALIDANEKCR